MQKILNEISLLMYTSRQLILVFNETFISFTNMFILLNCVLPAKDSTWETLLTVKYIFINIRKTYFEVSLLSSSLSLSLSSFLMDWSSIINKSSLNCSSNCIGESKSIYSSTSLCTNWTVNCCGKYGWFLKADFTSSYKSSKSFT